MLTEGVEKKERYSDAANLAHIGGLVVFGGQGTAQQIE